VQTRGRDAAAPPIALRGATGRIQVDIPVELPPVCADAARLERILTNLLSNALKYSAPGTPVMLRAQQQGDQVLITVTDHGKGIAPEDLPHLFELGFRTDQARGRAGGAGLGLTVVAAITAVHGGRVEAAPLAPAGLRVSLTVPRSPTALAAAQPPVAIVGGALLAGAPPIVPAPAVQASVPA
jgi:signal transduction histidine kinase